MNILHGTWIPDAEPGFIQSGGFYLWAETTDRAAGQDTTRHPLHLGAAKLTLLLRDELGILPATSDSPKDCISPQYFLLPSADQQPLPSIELARYLEVDLPPTFDLQYWQIDCYRIGSGSGSDSGQVNNTVKLLNELHFLALHNLAEMQLGADLLFWYHYTQALKQVIFNDQYIPALKYRELTADAKAPSAHRSTMANATKTAKTSKTKTAATPAAFEIYPSWELIGGDYEAKIQQYAECIPGMCTAGCAVPQEIPQLYDRESVLRHFSECLLTNVVTHTPSTQAFEKTLSDSLIADCLHPDASGSPWRSADRLEQFGQWQAWRDRIVQTQTNLPFYLCFQLQDPSKSDDAWQLQLQMAPKHDPSLRLSLHDYWHMSDQQRQDLRPQFGEAVDQHLLMHLGYAARIYPRLWAGLETDQPVGIALDVAAAFEFLKESAWVLENAGYKVIVPAWWTPQGRQRAKVRLKVKGKSGAGSSPVSNAHLSFDTLVQYQYELAIGDQPVSQQEWKQLVNAKTPLVQFRGQWIELDPSKMGQMLEFWQTQQQKNPDMSLLNLMKLAASDNEDSLELEFDREESLADMMARLQDKSRLEAIANPQRLQGSLRDYQKRGVSWLNYLEQLGLNGCLADDMGLGKTIQVIARLVQEQELAEADETRLAPTLLVAPTSVVGNWQREIAKFAPHLRVTVHHGSDRAKESPDLKQLCRQHDVLITSFTIARKDVKLLSGITWHRIVLDEAQNIKNPKASQTKAILKLQGTHRLALTGTPVENRLMDLWSIFNFLNPGYLGTQTQFRKNFELPIQKNNDPQSSVTLKKLVEPFILRRVKTDRAIIQDLPDKVEQKLYCNLTKEQASLYGATVKDVEQQIQNSEGIQRQGLILSTLMKLKQICNHPMQFLQDGSEFTPERSHKLSRLLDMVHEVMAEGESLLIFTQFNEIGAALHGYLRHTCRYPAYYLHGGTSRSRREQMIAEFQDPETEPSAFVLSLKAGGVGITLTKANHVFHFDRWWNPAVEDQATDRAFRIGQQKNVFVHKFVAIGTLEERIDDMIEDKKKLAGAIVGADESWLTELDNDSFKRLIALNQSAILE